MVKGRTGFRLLVICILYFCFAFPALADDWRTEFDDICSQVQVGTSLSKGELRSLIDRTDALVQRLEKMDLETKEVFLYRLKKCRSFFQYIIDLKGQESPEA